MPVPSRSLFRLTATRLVRPPVAYVPRRFAGDYGSVQSGHDQGVNEDNPKKHLEHPGPEPPSTKSGTTSSSSGSQGIKQPKSAAEDENEEVRKHNEEMKNRAEKSANQLAEEDNKVDKKFWTGRCTANDFPLELMLRDLGDVGDIKKDG